MYPGGAGKVAHDIPSIGNVLAAQTSIGLALPIEVGLIDEVRGSDKTEADPYLLFNPAKDRRG